MRHIHGPRKVVVDDPNMEALSPVQSVDRLAERLDELQKVVVSSLQEFLDSLEGRDFSGRPASELKDFANSLSCLAKRLNLCFEIQSGKGQGKAAVLYAASTGTPYTKIRFMFRYFNGNKMTNQSCNSVVPKLKLTSLRLYGKKGAKKQS